jgi:CheY-like chemotaxis protein
MRSRSPRILCVEDHADTRELVVFLLGSHGCDVVAIGGPEEALELARRQTFDLYLIDNPGLPEYSGIELCRKLRSFDLHTPILFCSGAAYEVDREVALASGAQGYLVKPIDNSELIAEVMRLTEK